MREVAKVGKVRKVAHVGSRIAVLQYTVRFTLVANGAVR